MSDTIVNLLSNLYLGIHHEEKTMATYNIGFCFLVACFYFCL
ncbi:hypothetical protein D030_1420 [Vibrio parahaemolyticus AQ3810]|nr:hypothetical protein D030_1420 [Vibrio parahaemolyticus AQ3810]